MLIRTVVAPLLGTNCYVLSDDAGRCVVVDPGFGVVQDVLRIVAEERLRPLAVLATHGHVDHTWAAADLTDALGAPFMVHADDAPRILDPFGTLGPLGADLAATAASLGQTYRVPSRLVPFTVTPDGALDPPLPAALPATAEAFELTALHAPGHTQGSTIFLFHADDADDDGTRGPGPAALTGDVLFAGTIGRTDLPGGDAGAMRRTLGLVAALDEHTLVLPGHGPASRISTERTHNPYLRVSG